MGLIWNGIIIVFLIVLTHNTLGFGYVGLSVEIKIFLISDPQESLIGLLYGVLAMSINLRKE